MPPLILYNGFFINPGQRTKNIYGLLIKHGVIEDIYYKKVRLPAQIKKLNLKHNYVLPGFIDCHTHLISRGIELQRLDLEKCSSLSDCLDKIREYAGKNTDIIFASNWDDARWRDASKDTLNKDLLDKLSKKKPIIMRRICGHQAVVNSRALALIPEHWRFVNRKTGHLYEDVALNLNEIFKPSTTMLRTAIELGTDEALSKGITSIQEISNIKRFKLLQQIKKNNGLRIRFAVYLLVKYYKDIIAAGLCSGFGDDDLKFAGIKVFLDGAIGAKTAALIKPYNKEKIRGRILLSTRKIARLIENAEQNMIQLMMHTIGDRSTAEVVNLFARVLKKKGRKVNPLRHRLEHVELISPSLFSKIARLNLIASMQPNFVRRWQQPGGLYEKYLGKRFTSMNPFRTLHKYGVKIVFGSDCMPLGPFFGMPGAFEHPFAYGRLTRAQTLRFYTKEGAYATFDEQRKGIIEKGKLADLVILDQNPLTARNYDNIKVLMTIVGGKIVYRKSADML